MCRNLEGCQMRTNQSTPSSQSTQAPQAIEHEIIIPSLTNTALWWPTAPCLPTAKKEKKNIAQMEKYSIHSVCWKCAECWMILKYRLYLIKPGGGHTSRSLAHRSGRVIWPARARLLEVCCIELRVTNISILLVVSPSFFIPISRC